ncbi:CPBP family intramembrane metalloprotease [Arthrobacter rhombi]|uniref:CPBP family intramembrane glutamic endopeptidase n=1 Tax=Arthrobacter rhombi TaxID=71253 RepID=UPI0031D9E0A1
MTSTHPLDPPRTPSAEPPEPLAYHRLARERPTYRWWRPLAVGATALGFYLALLLVALIGLMIASVLVPGIEQGVDGFYASETLDLNDPATLVLSLGSIALMLPALWLATRVLGTRPVGLLSSVAGRLRWTWLLWCVAVAILVQLVAQGIFLLLPATGTEATPMYDGGRTLAVLAAALLLVPIQAAAEEYVFRGYLMQSLGGWLRHPAFAILLPIPLFVVGHDYELLGQIDIAVFALAAGWLTWRTGGLEAALALHIVGNTTIFVLVAFGAADANADDLHVGDLLASLAMTAVFVLVITRLAAARGIQRTRRPSAPRPAQLPAPAQFPAETP